LTDRKGIVEKMKGLRMLTYTPGEEAPTVTDFDKVPTLAELQAAVGGYIETVPFFDKVEVDGKAVPCIAFCNEEGKLQRLPVNDLATFLWAQLGMQSDFLVGPVCIIYGDEKLLRQI
jgi:hypothetical protein